MKKNANTTKTKENTSTAKPKKENKEIDEEYFKRHPQLWTKPKKIVRDKANNSLEKLKILQEGGIQNLLSFFDLPTLIKFLQINRDMSMAVKKSHLVKKFLEVKDEYIENKTKTKKISKISSKNSNKEGTDYSSIEYGRIRINYDKYSVIQLLRNNCELYGKFAKKYKMTNRDSIYIFGELLRRQLIREYKIAKINNSNINVDCFNLIDFKLKDFGISILNYAIRDIDYFKKIILSGNKESISNFSLIKSFVNVNKRSLLVINFSNNGFSDVIGVNLFIALGFNCPNIQIINVGENNFSHTTFQHENVKDAFQVGYKKLQKLIINNNLLGTRGAKELFINLKNCSRLNLLNISYNGIDNDLFNDKNVISFFNDTLPCFYTLYYDGNFLQTNELQNLVKVFLHNTTLTYLYLQNNQINDESLELISFLLSNNSYLHTINLSYNKFTSKGVKHICEALTSTATRLIELHLANNNLDETSLSYLSDALEKNKTISCLNFSYNNFSTGNCGEYITNIINKAERLTSLNLTACHLGLKIKGVLEAIEGNKKISILDLSVNDIGNNKDIFKALSKMISNNYYLKYIYLDSNYIGEKDFESLICEGIANNKNLNLLSLKSNKITLNLIKTQSEKIKKDKKKVLQTYLESKTKKNINSIFMQNRGGYFSQLLVRDYEYLQTIKEEINAKKGILPSIKKNDHIKIILLDGNPIEDQESLIKLNTVLKFNGDVQVKNLG